MYVVNIKKKNLNKMGYSDFQDWLEKGKGNHIYIGRNMTFFVPGTTKSKWANPFSVKKYGRHKCLELYKQYIINSNLYNELHELDDKILGCWCYPEQCHGDILIELIKEK